MTVGAADDRPPFFFDLKKNLLKEWKWTWLSSEKSQDAALPTAAAVRAEVRGCSGEDAVHVYDCWSIW